MKTGNLVHMRILLLLLGLSLAASAGRAAGQSPAPTQTSKANNVVMYLGKVEVRGQRKIIKTLQAIKVGLTMPYSTDPKLANVVVCRLQDEAGSHLKQWLTCGTNRNLIANRDALQTTMISTAQYSDANYSSDGGGATCMSSGCYTAEFGVFNEVLNAQPGQYIHALVNGPGLRTLLHRIPFPKSQKNSTSAPSATTQQP